MKEILKKVPFLVPIVRHLRRIKEYLAFNDSYNNYKKNKISEVNADWKIIDLHVKSGGTFNSKFAKYITFFRKKHQLNPKNGLFANEMGENVVKKLQQDGYYVFDTKLPADKLQKLQEFALKCPAKPLENIDGKFQYTQPVLFDKNKVISTKYNFAMQDIIENEVVQDLCADESILWLMQEYLGAAPVLDLLAMWWSTDFQGDATSEVAQLYHFDMDRIKFVKIFFYINDVTPTNGPHCFVRGSHLHKPKELLSRGYVRISDEDIEKNYPKQDILEICGQAGTILMVDTSGFHKGAILTNGERILLQFEFAVSMYGANYPKLAITDKIATNFKSKIDKYGNTYKEIFA